MEPRQIKKKYVCIYLFFPPPQIRGPSMSNLAQIFDAH